MQRYALLFTLGWMLFTSPSKADESSFAERMLELDKHEASKEIDKLKPAWDHCRAEYQQTIRRIEAATEPRRLARLWYGQMERHSATQVCSAYDTYVMSLLTQSGILSSKFNNDVWEHLKHWVGQDSPSVL